MAELSTVARPYAEAVFKLSQEAGNSAGWSDALSLLEMVVKDPQMESLIGNPRIQRQQLVALIDSVVGQHLDAHAKQFVEVLIAPSYSSEALKILSNKQNVRVLQIPLSGSHNSYDLKRVGGGILVQTPDAKNVNLSELKVVTKKQPSPHELEEMLFAWKVAKYVKSNAIVFCANGMTLGVGAGQMSRIDSAKIAGIKANNAGLSLIGSVVASDAFFPFRDGLDVVVAAGATCVIQPGGSVRDDEVVQAADEHGIVMVYTGTRHFRH